MNLETIYEDNSANLIVVSEFTPGKSYITEDGTRIRYFGSEDNDFKFKILTSSPMKGGVKISEFEKPNALEMFWRLLNKASDYEYTDRDY